MYGVWLNSIRLGVCVCVCVFGYSLVGALFPLPRIIFAMAEDGLLFKALAHINHKTLTPTLATIVAGVLAGTNSLINEAMKLFFFQSNIVLVCARSWHY